MALRFVARFVFVSRRLLLRLSEADLEAEYHGRRSHRLRSAVSDNTRRKRNRAGFYSYLDDAKGNFSANSKRKTKVSLNTEIFYLCRVVYASICCFLGISSKA